jgi:hypothetical protein
MSSRPLRIAVADHNGKSRAFVSALLAAGHQLVGEGPTDLFLIDTDPPTLAHRPTIDRFKQAGATVVIYPHGGGSASAVVHYDGLWEPYEAVDANLVTGLGHAEVLRRIEHATPTHVVGWTYCELRPFRPCADIRHVVFAPTHPNADGSMPDRWRARNGEIFAQLVDGPWRLTVRHVGSIEENGLWEADGVEFVNGRRHAEFVEIDAADAVVAGEGTFPTLAIARGVPTVIYDQLPGLAIGLPGEVPIPPRLRERYADYARYPFDAADGPLDEVLHAAAADEGPIVDWKRRFIGRPLHTGSIVALLERLAVGGEPPVRLDPTRAFTTVAFAEELLERPALLAEYAAAVGPADDATLILWAPGLDGDGLLALAEQAVAAAGLDGDALPDILLPPLPGSPAADAALAERADAVLSEWPPAGRLGGLPRWAQPQSRIGPSGV